MATIAEMLVKIGADTSELHKKMEGVGKTVKGVGDKMKSAGAGLTKAITLPLAGLSTAAFAAANDLDAAYGNIRAGTGATGDDLEALKTSFKNVFENVPESADEVSSALADLNTRTGQTGKPLEDLTKQFLELGRVSGEEVPALIESGTRAFGDWGIAVEDQSDTMDHFWKVSQTTGIGVNDLMNKMVQFGAPLRQMGFDFETSAAMLGKFEKEGVNTELVMGSMRQALGKMAKEGISAEEGLTQTVDAIKNAGSTSEANAAAIELFGARAGPDMAAAIREGRFEVEDLVATIGDSGETISSAAEDTETFGDKFKELKNKTQTALEPLGIILLQLAEEWLPKIIDAVKRVAEWFANLSPAMQKTIVIFGAIAAAIGPVLMVVGTLISLFAGLIPIAGALGIGVGALVGIMAGVVAGIIALVAAGILIWKNWDTIKAKTVEIWGAIKEFLSATWQWIKDTASAVWAGIKSFFSTTWEAIKQTAITVFTAVKDFFVNIWNTIKTTTSNIVTGIVEFFKNKWNNLKSNTMAIFNTVKDFLSNLWSNIKSSISNIVSALINRVKTYWTNLKSNTTSIFNGVKSFIIDTWNNIKSRLNSIVEGIKNTVKTKITSLKIAVQTKMTETKQKIIDIWNQAKDFLANIDLLQIGKDIMQGLLNGIGSMAGKLKKKAGEIADGIKDKIKGALKIASPSKVMRYEVGQEVGAGLMVGMDDMERKINRSAQSMANSAIPDVPSQQPAVSSASKQPATLILQLGNREFETFVDDIFNVGAQNMRMSVRKG